MLTDDEVKVLIALKRARQRITDPKNWTREYQARDAHGKGVNYDDARATCWCALGAARVEAETPFIYVLCDNALKRAAGAKFGFTFPESVNDDLGHEKTLEMFDVAIATLQGAAPPMGESK